MTVLRWISSEVSDNSARYDMLLYIGKSKYCIGFYDAIHRSIAGYAENSYPSESHRQNTLSTLKYAAEQEPWLGINVKRHKICLLQEKNTLLPAQLFESKSAEKYLNAIAEPEEKHMIAHDYISYLNGYNIYSIHKKIFKKLHEYFHAPKVWALDSVMICNLLREHTGTRDKKLVVFKDDNAQHIYYIDNGKLIFCNHFNCETKEDFTYYILAVCEQLRLNTHSLPVVLCGSIEKEDAWYSLLESYLEHITFAEFPKGIFIPEPIQQMLPHRCYHLLALSLCE